MTEQSKCLRRKTTVLTKRNYDTYPVNLLGPVPKHLSAFYINETERFGDLFMVIPLKLIRKKKEKKQ